MSDLSSLPLQDNFSTTLSQKLLSTEMVVHVNSIGTFLFGSNTTKAVINPGKSNMELVEISAKDGTAKTFTIITRGLSLANGVAGVAKDHSVGSEIIISDNFSFWADIQAAINSKFDKTGGTVTGPTNFTDSVQDPVYADDAARDAAIPSPQDGMSIINLAAGLPQDYYGGTWNNRGNSATPNASDTVAGKSQIATQAKTDAGDDVGSTLAKNVLVPSRTAKAIQDQKWIYCNDVGIADAYVIAPVPALSGNVAGQKFAVLIAASNTGPSTLDAGPGPLPIVDSAGNALAGGELLAGLVYEFTARAADFQLTSQSGLTPTNFVTKTSISSQGGQGSNTDNVGPGGGAYSTSGNIDIDVTPFSATDKVQLFYTIYVKEVHNVNPGAVTRNSGIGQRMALIGEAGAGYSNEATPSLAAIPSPWENGTITIQGSDVDTSTVACSAAGSTISVAAPVWSGNNLRFVWTHTGNLAGTSLATATVQISVVAIRLAN